MTMFRPGSTGPSGEPRAHDDGRWCRARRRLNRMGALSPGGRGLLLRSMVLLPAVAGLARWLGLQRARAVLLRVPGARMPDLPPPAALPIAVQVAEMVELAARLSRWQPTCLDRSLMLWWLLQRRGVTTSVRIGARPGPPGKAPSFHSWVEFSGRVLNDRPDVAADYAMLELPEKRRSGGWPR